MATIVPLPCWCAITGFPEAWGGLRRLGCSSHEVLLPFCHPYPALPTPAVWCHSPTWSCVWTTAWSQTRT